MKRYFVFEGNTVNNLENAVNMALAEGWNLVGGMMISKECTFYQPMVRDVPDAKPEPQPASIPSGRTISVSVPPGSYDVEELGEMVVKAMSEPQAEPVHPDAPEELWTVLRTGCPVINRLNEDGYYATKAEASDLRETISSVDDKWEPIRVK